MATKRKGSLGSVERVHMEQARVHAFAAKHSAELAIKHSKAGRCAYALEKYAAAERAFGASFDNYATAGYPKPAAYAFQDATKAVTEAGKVLEGACIAGSRPALAGVRRKKKRKR